MCEARSLRTTFQGDTGTVTQAQLLLLLAGMGKRHSTVTKFTGPTLNWFRLGEQMGQESIEGDYEPDKAPFYRIMVAVPATVSAMLVGFFAVGWLLL